MKSEERESAGSVPVEVVVAVVVLIFIAGHITANFLIWKINLFHVSCGSLSPSQSGPACAMPGLILFCSTTRAAMMSEQALLGFSFLCRLLVSRQSSRDGRDAVIKIVWGPGQQHPHHNNKK